jgi:hypothetical protein
MEFKGTSKLLITKKRLSKDEAILTICFMFKLWQPCKSADKQ